MWFSCTSHWVRKDIVWKWSHMEDTSWGAHTLNMGRHQMAYLNREICLFPQMSFLQIKVCTACRYLQWANWKKTNRNVYKWQISNVNYFSLNCGRIKEKLCRMDPPSRRQGGRGLQWCCLASVVVQSVMHLSCESGKYYSIYFSKGELRCGQKPWDLSAHIRELCKSWGLEESCVEALANTLNH